jgi:site-specific DNA recombinase
MSNPTRLRAIGPRRLSNDTDESTSLKRQEQQIAAQAIAKDLDLIDTPEDTDTSGAISPFERKELGPWLTDPELIAQWDVLIVAKLDRLSRSIIDFGTLLKWCQEHGKTIISVAESLDFGTAAGRMFANLLIMFAQFERERMSERRSEAAAKLRRLAHWNGGTVSFGYMPVCICHAQQQCKKASGWELMPDPVIMPIVQHMAEMAIGGSGSGAIARWLNKEGVPTPQGGTTWRPTSVLAVLRNPALRGYVTQTKPNGTGKRYNEPKIIRNDDGTPVRRTPIVDDDTWFRLQAALDGMRRRQGYKRSDGHPLLGVAFCDSLDEAENGCGAPLWALRQTNKQRKNGGVWNYYACSRRNHGECKARGIPMADLDAEVERQMISTYSMVKFPEKVVTPGVDHEAELATINQQIAELDEAHQEGELPTRAYARQVSHLEALREALEAEQTPGGVEYVDAEDTVADRFLAVTDPEQRRQMMLSLGIRVDAVLLAKGNLSVNVWSPDLAARANVAAM